MKKYVILNYYYIECLFKNELYVYCKLIKRGFLNKIKNKNDILFFYIIFVMVLIWNIVVLKMNFFLEVLEVKVVIEVLKK